MATAEYFISTLKMEKHIEGGFFREIYRSSQCLTIDNNDSGAQRNLCTTIYFLLEGEQVSRFHSLKHDEIWFYHHGSSVTIHTINSDGVLESKRLGVNIEAGEQPQVLISANCIFAAENVLKDSFSLVSCLVAPGFDFEDFQMYDQASLCAMFPQHTEIIKRLG